MSCKWVQEPLKVSIHLSPSELRIIKIPTKVGILNSKAPATEISSITWTVHLSHRTRFAPCDKLKVFESCPKAPLSARSQNDKIHLIKMRWIFSLAPLGEGCSNLLLCIEVGISIMSKFNICLFSCIL